MKAAFEDEEEGDDALEIGARMLLFTPDSGSLYSW